MKRYIFALVLALLPLPASALGVREVSQSIAEKGFQLNVSSKGIAINFLKVGEQVTFVDISHKRDFVVYGDGALCVGNQGCSGAPVSILFLRRIQPLAFEGVIPASDGVTHLFVKTGSSQGSALYQFAINPVSSSGYSVIEIVEDKPKVAFTPKPQPPRPISRLPRLPAPVKTPPAIKINLPPAVKDELDGKPQTSDSDQPIKPKQNRDNPKVEPEPKSELSKPKQQVNRPSSVKEELDDKNLKATPDQPSQPTKKGDQPKIEPQSKSSVPDKLDGKDKKADVEKTIKPTEDKDTPPVKSSKPVELDLLTQSELKPNPDGKTPDIALKAPTSNPPKTTRLKQPSVPTHIRYANAIARGMVRDPVTRWDWEWRKINTAIRILRRGGSLPSAAKRSGLSEARLSELIRLGGVTL